MLPDSVSPAVANMRDASFIASPRHDGPGGHRPGTWSPRFHVKIDHPARGASWSGCGCAFLLGSRDVPVAEVPVHQRCQRRGCKERWPDV